ncbi:MAG: hypothetical protein P0Y59_02700 [Candidatus Sphingomonas phytovorans]|nr:hypothetical protein [Sphingomonas sp.]WEK00621.1 MAG: hypothetical protein P0Y59_02700 [Sphingomonas sp.]
MSACISFGEGRVLHLQHGLNVSSDAMEGMARALAALPANSRVTVAMDTGEPMAQPVRRMEQLLKWVELETGVSRQIIVASSREPSAVRARDAFSWGACQLLGRTKSEVARKLGGRDATSVGAAVRRGEQLRETDAAFRDLAIRMAALFTGAVS